MGFVIAAIVVLLLVAGFVTFLVLDATRRAGGAGPREPRAEGRAVGADGEQRPRVGDPGPEAVAAEPGSGSDRTA